jgi:predicted nuclease of predicted toxin-antitoxin system
MELAGFKFITDENIQTKAVDYLTALGLDIFDIKQMGLQGIPDHEILDLAVHKERIILTQDSDFGTDFLHRVFGQQELYTSALDTSIQLKSSKC